MRRLVAMMALGVTVFTMSGCEGRGRNTQTANVSNPRAVHCTITADGPKRDAEPPKTIVGRVRFRCDNPGAEALTLTVRLQKRSGSTWQTVASQTVTVKGEDTHAQFFKYRTREVKVACAAGKFRTTVDWTKLSHGKTAKGSSRSGTAIDPCAPRIFS
ncbi:MAG TPA: hypothetical protein VFE14_17890 [Micromonosporaceae bacterium]|nr:hypothetical protein [Micromonosporaceae bacterium]